ncbi:MAG: hypothetical protein WC376_04600 [Candidatus Nanoarchaeia archaeon]|jgi:hypothetical protein
MRKTQIAFEDFIVGFLMFFGLASTVFLFINSGGGSDIDFFNTSIYQEEKFELDFVYLTIYEDNQVDTSKYSFDPNTLTLNFSLRRTNLPSGDYLVQYSNMPVKVIVSWKNCTIIDGCWIEKDERIIPYTFRVNNNLTEGNILKGDEVNYSYSFNDSFKNIKYTGCSSNITFRLEIVSEYFNETALANNEYTMLVPFCFYEPVDLRVLGAGVPQYPGSTGSYKQTPLQFNPSTNYPVMTLNTTNVNCWGFGGECKDCFTTTDSSYVENDGAGCSASANCPTSTCYINNTKCVASSDTNCYYVSNSVDRYSCAQGSSCSSCVGTLYCTTCWPWNTFGITAPCTTAISCERQSVLVMGGNFIYCGSIAGSSCSTATTESECDSNHCANCTWDTGGYSWDKTEPYLGACYLNRQQCQWYQGFSFDIYSPYIIKIMLKNDYNAPLNYRLSFSIKKDGKYYRLLTDQLIVIQGDFKDYFYEDYITIPSLSYQYALIDLRMTRIELLNENTGELVYVNPVTTGMFKTSPCSNQYFKITATLLDVYDTDVSNNEIERFVGWCI